DPTPGAAVELRALSLTSPVPAERDHLVLAVLVEGRDQPFELAPVFGPSVLDPQLVVGLGQRTLRPRFERATLESRLRHISKDNQQPLVAWNRFAASRHVDPRRRGRSRSQRRRPPSAGGNRGPVR